MPARKPADAAAAPAAAPAKGGKTPPATPKAQPAQPAAQSQPDVVVVDPPKVEPPKGGQEDPGDKQPPADPPVDPVIDNPAPNENDCEFVLRIFGVPPEKYMKDGALDRESLQVDLNTRRHLFANRVLHRRSGA